ncbi:Bro-N domain-containing protein [Candidatus Woesearchaeota archaeon]|nr:Bro-N domain-containing protein [Candidatus Woesearchaeota archaeon]
MAKEETQIAIFKGKKIRRKFVENKWFFSIIDIIEVLTESTIPKRYWSDLKIKLKEEGFESYDKIVQLKLKSGDGKEYETDCADTEGIFRIIQSIPSKKAEPFKRWLAHVGYERLQEIENPELAQERMKELYEKKGYSKIWIDKRLRGIAVRQDLTDEWKKRGIEEQSDFAILTAEISKASFGMTPNEYKKFKGLKNENLRDHMNDLELIFNMLGEASTSEIEKTQNPEQFKEHIRVSKKGGEIARNAREELEQETGESVINEENYLEKEEKDTREKKKKKKILIQAEILR